MITQTKPQHAQEEWSAAIAALLEVTGLPSCHPGDYAMHAEDDETLRAWAEGIGFLYGLQVGPLVAAIEAYIGKRADAVASGGQA